MARVDPEAELFMVFGYSPIRIPEGCRSAVAEAVARANYGLKLGKFEMDLDDGELRFQAAQILTDGALGDGVVDRLICLTIGMLDMYLPAFLSVVYGNESPQDAVRCVEAGCHGGEAESEEEGAD